MNINFLKKNILITCFIFFKAITSYCQPPSPGSNIYTNDINKFEGTWKWHNTTNTQELVIKLKKVHHYWNSNFMLYYQDVLVGVHCYIENGITIENNLAIFPNLNSTVTGSIMVRNVCWDGECPNDVEGTIKDISKNKYGKLVLTYHNSTPATFTWNLRNLGDVFVQLPGQAAPDVYLTLPLECILVKQP
jgi:hypothetical protein